MAKAITARPTKDAGTVSWLPGPVRLGFELDPQQNHFGDQNEMVGASVNGGGATLEQNDDNGVQVNFGDGDLLLQTERPRDTILLTFTPPVRAAAVQIAAFGLANTNPVSFTALSQATLTDTTLTRVKKTPTTTTGARDGSAVTLGFQCEDGDAPILSLGFSVEPLGPAQALRSFGINQVTFAERQIAPMTVTAAAGPKVRKAGS
ncbi:MAG: hypothetical protein ACR2I2_10055 [Bryobacteraceae bacterium]